MRKNTYSDIDKVVLPAVQLPVFRSNLAHQRGVASNLLFKTWGGIGDQICSEPTLRFALKVFKDCNITLASELPELFTHLEFKEVINLKKHLPREEKYIVFETITQPNETNLVWQFFSHMLTNCVDFPSMCALRLQLPIADREVKLPDIGYSPFQSYDDKVIIHAGKHWPSKTFPTEWWNEVLRKLIDKGFTPVLIGADADENKSTVEVNNEGCLDLRNQLTIPQTISLLKRSKVLFTNDSSPLHMAVDSECHIGFIASCKHPDYIMHWRRKQWAWRMKNLGLDGAWNHVSFNPNSDKEVKIEFLPQGLMEKILPAPDVVAEWCQGKLLNYGTN